MITVVTSDHSFAPMIGQGHVTIRTLNGFTAGPTKDKTGIASAVEQDNRLLAPLICFFNSLQQVVGKDARLFVESKLLTHIYNSRRRHSSVGNSLGQVKVTVFACLGVMKGFE